MNANEYQIKAMRTKADPGLILTRLATHIEAQRVMQLLVGLNGLVNEVGELSEIVKASVEYGKGPVDKVHVTEEVGDCCWRLAQICDALGIRLEDCMEKNIAKLAKRYPEKFTDELALNRNLVAERTVLEDKIDADVFERMSPKEINKLVNRVYPPHDPGMPDPTVPGGYSGMSSQV